MYNILIFHHYNSPLGAGLSLLHILEKINLKQARVSVCLPVVVGELDSKIKKMGIKVIYSDSVAAYMHFSGGQNAFVSRKHIQNFSKIFRSRKGISEIIEKENPDIVVVNSMTLCWIGRIARELNKKTICFHRESYCKGFIGVRTSLIKHELREWFDVVAFLSDYDIQQTPKGRAKYIKITDKVDVKLYEKLDVSKCRRKLQLPLNCKLVLYVGGISKLKGPMTIIKAMRFIKTEEVKLVFLQYEEPNMEGVIRRIKYRLKCLLGRNLHYNIMHYIQRNRMEDKIIFRPATDKVEIYFTACDLVVFPSHSPHQARPIYEAGIAKKPIVITDFPNTREFADETCGWLLKKDDYLMLAKHIDDVFGNHHTSRVEENYIRVLNNNNLENLSEELFDMFEKLMEKRCEK